MDALPDHIADLIRQGRKIEAITLIREETGVGLKEAKDAVDALSLGEDPLEPEPVDPERIPEDVQALARAGRKIEAIKLVRERTGLGLKEAKELVETIPGVPVASGRAVVLAAAILVLLIGLAVAFAVTVAGCAAQPVTAGPVFAGPMTAPPVDDLTGGYGRAHTVEVFDGEDWAPTEVHDTLTVRQRGDTLDVAFELLHTNAHLCAFEGTAVRDGEGYVARAVPDLANGDEVCTLRLTASPDSITLHDEGGVCRRHYCGARGSIDGIAFSR